jgi:hypothetical protein
MPPTSYNSLLSPPKEEIHLLDIMPYFPMTNSRCTISATERSISGDDVAPRTIATKPPVNPPASVQIKNRRKRYLDQHPGYFSADLELAGPLALVESASAVLSTDMLACRPITVRSLDSSLSNPSRA